VSAFLSGVAQQAASAGSSWFAGPTTVVVAALSFVLLLQREMSRGLLTSEREQRLQRTAVVVVPLVLCAVLTLGARLLELLT
jgi:uncharacterized linocin/CFP29 family protein